MDDLFEAVEKVNDLSTIVSASKHLSETSTQIKNKYYFEKQMRRTEKDLIFWENKKEKLLKSSKK